jgi:hypothetical protein
MAGHVVGMRKKFDKTSILRGDQLDHEILIARAEFPDSSILTRALQQLVTALESPQARDEATRELGTKLAARRRRRIAIAMPLVGLGLVAIPVGAAAVGSWTAHTGTYGDPATNSEVIDRSEWLGLDAPDASAAVAALYDNSLQLPTGASPSDVIDPVSKLLKGMGVVPKDESGHVTIQETTVRVLFEKAGQCLWYREWLESDLLGDNSDRQAAVAGIRIAASWPATGASDGGGVVDHLRSVADSAAAGNRSTVLGAYASCENFYGPALK